MLLGGDIGESTDLAFYLKALDARLERPIDFVLGNHDYYHGSGIEEVRRRVVDLCRELTRLNWLSAPAWSS